MATKVTPLGNLFDFYVPRVLGAKQFSKPMTYKPYAFIQKHFKAAGAVPFGSKGKPPAIVAISDVDFAAAILECGYGRRAEWKTHLALSSRECAELMHYLKARLALVLASFRVENQSRLPRFFYKKLEASEKVSLSFILGGMGAYLAAQEWLKAGGDPVRSFLHVGIYAKASIKPGRLISFSLRSRKSPDFLVEAQSGKWHVFESKGGVTSGRWSRICEGLSQLESLPPIGWFGASTAPAETCVCVHTSIDHGRPLVFTAIDPPADIDSDAEPFTLIEGAARLFQALEAIEQFKALRTGANVKSPELDRWTVAPTSFSESISIGIPSRYLRAEKLIRRRLAVFLAVREFLETERRTSRSETFTDRLRRSVRLKLKPNEEDDGALVVSRIWLDRKLERLPRQRLQGFFLLECARALKFDELVDLIEVSYSERKRILFESRGSQKALTSAGLLLLQTSQGEAPMRAVEAPSTSRG
ncbi:hypothetical protein BGLT_03625 [Caballeronia glathei]|uniref:Uncharacterized protein n=1 Tax=Caballeronia glathei TaxID=60547 RepID=A0A069PHV7_9BURK|nr:hypothetical protein [Caballeronia glathei]KDR40308.1 hypothetical protein BG61_26760 [Caballeronia glathei]CDY74683.1 hypothetical protein BGLT_03625 [Caballeronia glathei]